MDWDLLITKEKYKELSEFNKGKFYGYAFTIEWAQQQIDKYLIKYKKAQSDKDFKKIDIYNSALRTYRQLISVSKANIEKLTIENK